MTDKESLKTRKAELEKELSSIRKAINDWELNEKKEKYGDDMKCKNCRYDAIQNFSDDGWHNCCGNEKTYACTCCHSYCEYFEPDNEITKFIKKHLSSKHFGGVGYISKDTCEGLQNLVGNIFRITDEKMIKQVIDILKIIYEIKEDETGV